MTIIELMIVVGVLVAISFVIAAVMSSTRNATYYLEAATRATEEGQRVSLQISSLVETSRTIFEGDIRGQSYYDALDLQRDPPHPAARLPFFDEVRPLGPDEVGDARTGNILFFVRQGDPVAAVADGASGTLVDMTLHRFVCVYPRQTTRKLVPGAPPARDLVIWRSVVYASYAEITDIKDPGQRTSVVRDLWNRFGVAQAWDETVDADAAFYDLDSFGALAASPSPDARILEDLDLSNRGRLVFRDAQLALSDQTQKQRRPVLTRDDPAVWQPDGFEVKVAGLPSSRLVWMRLVIESPAKAGRGTPLFATTLIANAHEHE